MLLKAWQLRVEEWKAVFSQARTWSRATNVLLGLLCTLGRRTITGSLAFRSMTQTDWSADYRAFSLANWSCERLFDPVVAEVARYFKGAHYIPVSLDDTSLHKSSRVIASAKWMRDPLSPPFHVNLTYGLRTVHTAVTLPIRGDGYSGRAVSVGFDLAPPVRKPGKKASAEQREQYRFLKKKFNLSTAGLAMFERTRASLDAAGCQDQWMLAVVDGSYTNKTVLRRLPERTHLIGRVRKDIALFEPAPVGQRVRKYGQRLPTPEEFRLNEEVAYQTTSCHYGGNWRLVRYKAVSNVLWRGVSVARPVRLIVLAPTPYRAPGGRRRISYGDPAYLITTDLDTPATELIQPYLDRWQIEPLHRDLKTGLGLGQVQSWSPKSVTRVHTAMVAAYSMLQLAAIDTFGPERTALFPPLPSWRKRNPRRASQHDLITMLRNDAVSSMQEASTHNAKSSQRWSLPGREIYAYP